MAKIKIVIVEGKIWWCLRSIVFVLKSLTFMIMKCVTFFKYNRVRYHQPFIFSLMNEIESPFTEKCFSETKVDKNWIFLATITFWLFKNARPLYLLLCVRISGDWFTFQNIVVLMSNFWVIAFLMHSENHFARTFHSFSEDSFTKFVGWPSSTIYRVSNFCHGIHFWYSLVFGLFK